MSKWSNLLEADDAVREAEKAWRAHPSTDTIVTYATALMRAGRQPPAGFRRELGDTYRTNRSPSLAAVLWQLYPDPMTWVHPDVWEVFHTHEPYGATQPSLILDVSGQHDWVITLNNPQLIWFSLSGAQGRHNILGIDRLAGAPSRGREATRRTSRHHYMAIALPATRQLVHPGLTDRLIRVLRTLWTPSNAPQNINYDPRPCLVDLYAKMGLYAPDSYPVITTQSIYEITAQCNITGTVQNVRSFPTPE